MKDVNDLLCCPFCAGEAKSRVSTWFGDIVTVVTGCFNECSVSPVVYTKADIDDHLGRTDLEPEDRAIAAAKEVGVTKWNNRNPDASMRDMIRLVRLIGGPTKPPEDIVLKLARGIYENLPEPEVLSASDQNEGLTQ